MTPPAFQDNVVIVTGASSGIGRELALQLAVQRALLCLAARKVERLESIAAECERRGGSAIVVPTDVTAPAQCKQLIEAAAAQYGRIDTLVNNAGITMAFRVEELQDLSLPERIVKVNYLGSVYCTYYALPHLKQTKGRIVGVASLTGKAGVPTRSFYAASKHAMAGFFDSLRVEVADHGVSVTMVYPDFVKTEVRERALGADGRPVGISPASEGDFMTAEECARIIIRAAAKRRREVIMGLRGKIGLWLKVIAPGVVDRIAKRAIAKVQFTKGEPSE